MIKANEGIDWTKKNMYDGIGRPDLKKKAEELKLKREFDENERYMAQGIEAGAMTLVKIIMVALVIWIIFLLIHIF